jgi:hypothetical protein
MRALLAAAIQDISWGLSDQGSTDEFKAYCSIDRTFGRERPVYAFEQGSCDLMCL